MTDLRGKVVLITGASDGVGAACANAFRSRGARLSITGRSAEKLHSVASKDDLVTVADLAALNAAPLLIERTIERWGRIDVLINNAGMGIYWPVADSPEGATRELFELNFFAPLKLIQAAAPHMRKQRSGTIVNVGSVAGRVVLPWMPLYSASKSALGAITAGLRMDLAADGVHVMLVCPGYILTDFHRHSLGLPPPERVVQAKAAAITPEACARAIMRGVQRRRRVVITPWWSWFLIALNGLAPRLVEARLRSLNQTASAELPA